MDDTQTLLKVAIKLVKLMDKGADSLLPRQIVDVVKLHSKIAVGSAWIPVPGADMAAGAANIWTMYGRLNSKLGISIGDNILKTVGAGVATNLASYIAMSGAASALKLIPGVGSLFGAVAMSASLYAVTLVSGWVYMQALCYMAERKGGSLSGSDLKAAVDHILSNKSMIKSLIDSVKASYKS